MKTITKSLFACALGVAALFSAVPANADNAQLYVQVRQASLYSKPQYFSSVKGKVDYGEALTVLGTEGAWAKVQSPQHVEGFIHSSALSKRSIKVSANSKGAAGVDNSDISLAGKGFSAAVEKQLASQNAELNFAEVNRMERLSVSANELTSFVQSGKLNSAG